MDGIKVTFKGLDELFSKFNAAKSESLKATEIAMHATLAKAQQVSKGQARVRTGYMRANILIDGIKTSGGTVTGTYESKADYSSFNEYGTYKMSAKPFMRPGVSAATPFFYQRVKKALNEVMK